MQINVNRLLREEEQGRTRGKMKIWLEQYRPQAVATLMSF